MGDGCSIRIKRLANGFTVCMDDPAIIKANRAPQPKSDKSYRPWKDPSREFAFKDQNEVIMFIKKNIAKIVPEGDDDEYSTSFDTAVATTPSKE